MPIKKAAKKALRQSLKRRARNIRKKEKMKELLKEFKNLLSNKEIEKAKSLLPQIYKSLDKAAKTGLIKKNTASRKKSRMAKAIQRH